jgi:purine-binding chemotaxis protein CheW
MVKPYVTFTLGDTRWCLPVEQVVQIVRRENLSAVPKPAPFVEGVINIRGEIVPVFDLASRLAAARGEPLRDPSRRSGAEYRRRVVVARLGSRLCGLDVDEVREIVDVDDAALDAAEPPVANGGLVAGAVRVEGGPLMLLGLAAVLETGPAITERGNG